MEVPSLREGSSPQRSRRLTAVALFSAAFAPACGMMLDVQPSTSSGPCASDEDCPSEEACIAATCQPVCTSNGDCPVGEACLSYPDAQACGVPQDASTSNDGGSDATVDGRSDVFVNDANDAGDATVADAVADGDAGDAAEGDAAVADAGDAGASDAGDGAAVTACAVPHCTDGGCQWTTVLAGGFDDTYLYGDTWVWTDAGWKQAPPVDSDVLRRWGAAGAALCGQPWVFGGQPSATGPFANDLLSWDGTQWNTRDDGGSGAGPLPRSLPSAATASGKIVLFGGMKDFTAGPNDFQDTWVWDGTAWTEMTPVHSPPARSAAAIATLGEQVVLFGGNDDADSVPLADTWVWDGTDWTEAHPAHIPPARAFAAAVGLDDSVVLFGGTDDSSVFNDTWTWDGTDWTSRPTDAGPPPTAQMAGARWNDDALFFGGVNAAFAPVGTTWIWRGSAWIQQPLHNPTPFPRYASTMIGVPH
jgi:hypothetical protein